MRVLVICEFSGIVRDAFTAKGHDAWSCDLLASDTSGKHVQADIQGLDWLYNGAVMWDLLIAFPPCTYLCSSGLHWNKRRAGRQGETDKALKFVRWILDSPIKKIALENPVGCISTRIRPYDQMIHPWWFGHNESKATCLWLKNLPPLSPTKIIPPRGWQVVKFAAEMPVCECCQVEAYCEEHDQHFAECDCICPTQDDVTYKSINGVMLGTKLMPPPRLLWGNQTPSGQNKLGPSPTRWMERSRTYEGIARAMADQWG